MKPDIRKAFKAARRGGGKLARKAGKVAKSGASGAWKATNKTIDTTSDTLEKADKLADDVDKSLENVAAATGKKAFELVSKDSGETGEKAGRLAYKGAQLAISVKGLGLPNIARGALRLFGKKGPG